MAKVVIPEVVTYECDRCHVTVPANGFRVWIKVNKKDLGVGTVDDWHTYELGPECLNDLAAWWRS
jgi:hypothetical protein